MIPKPDSEPRMPVVYDVPHLRDSEICTFEAGEIIGIIPRTDGKSIGPGCREGN